MTMDIGEETPYSDLPAEDEGREIELTDGRGVAIEAEIDAQVATAKRYPRSITTFRRGLKEMVMAGPETAKRMWYSLPRGKNDDGSKRFVEGPSVRLAEAALAAWGNTRSGARPTDADETHVTCEAFCHDLQNNNYVAWGVKRRITYRDGTRYNEDMITVTAAAGSAIAWRNAIYKTVPKVFINEALAAAKLVVKGEIKSIADARANALKWWTSQGGKEEQLLSLFGRHGMDDVSLEDIIRLGGIKTAVEDGEATFASILDEARSSARGPVTTLTPESLSKGAKVSGQDNAKPGIPIKAAEKAAQPPAPGQTPCSHPAAKNLKPGVLTVCVDCGGNLILTKKGLRVLSDDEADSVRAAQQVFAPRPPGGGQEAERASKTKAEPGKEPEQPVDPSGDPGVAEAAAIFE